MIQIVDGTPAVVFETELPRTEDAVMSLSVHPKEKLIACGINGTDAEMKSSQNQSLRLFKVGKQMCEPFRKLAVPAASATAEDFQRITCFSPNGKFIATATNSSLVVFDYPELNVAFATEEGEEEVYDVDWSNDSKTLLLTSLKNMVVFETGPFKLVQKVGPASLNKSTPVQFRQGKFGVAESKDFAFFAVHTQKKDRGFISKWVTKPEWRQVSSVSIARKPILVMAISPNGEYLAAASSDGTLYILTTDRLKIIKRVPNVHGMAITCLSFTRDSAHVVSGGADNRIVVTPVVSEDSSTFIPSVDLLV
jgi:prolactin regulatory element-binding protein